MLNFRVVSYNIRIGTFNPLGLEGLARVIEPLSADLVGMQEVHVYANASGPVDQPRWLGERLGMTPAFGASREVPPHIVPDTVGQFGNALLSRYAIAATEVHLLPQPTPEDELRSVFGAAVTTPEGPLNVFITHWSLLPAHRALQAESTVAFVRGWRPGTPAVLMGDFNALPDAPEIATVRAALTDAWQAVGVPDEARISFPSGRPGQMTPDGWAAALDYVFVTPDISCRQVEVVHDESHASDHNPVLAVLGLGTD